MRPAAVGSAIDAPTLPLAVPDSAMAEALASSWANTAWSTLARTHKRAARVDR